MTLSLLLKGWFYLERDCADLPTLTESQSVIQAGLDHVPPEQQGLQDRLLIHFLNSLRISCCLSVPIGQSINLNERIKSLFSRNEIDFNCVRGCTFFHILRLILRTMNNGPL